MKRVSHTLTYPATTVADVYAMLADPAYRRAVADHQGVVDFSCEVEHAAGGGMVVRIDEAHGVHRLPSFAQKLVGDEIRLVKEETWGSATGADLHVTIPGRPGEMTGSARLVQSGPDVVQHVDLTVRVGIPLVGGRVEDLVSDFAVRAYDAEGEVGRGWLQGDRHA